jgi:hypothetical protein
MQQGGRVGGWNCTGKERCELPTSLLLQGGLVLGQLLAEHLHLTPAVGGSLH